jgi:hypothetical protein
MKLMRAVDVIGTLPPSLDVILHFPERGELGMRAAINTAMKTDDYL